MQKKTYKSVLFNMLTQVFAIKSHVPTPHCEDHAHIHEGPDCQSQNDSSVWTAERAVLYEVHPVDTEIISPAHFLAR